MRPLNTDRPRSIDATISRLQLDLEDSVAADEWSGEASTEYSNEIQVQISDGVKR